MPFNPFSALGAKLAMMMSAMLLGVLLLTTYNKNSEIHSLEDDKERLITRVATAERSLGRSQANTAALRAAVDTQNKSVEAMGAATAQAAARGVKALSDARKSNAGINAKLDQLAKRPPLPAGADLCKAADAVLLESVR